MKGRILVMGGHEFDRLDGNEAICDHIIELTGGRKPEVCLLPTASGDPEDQISRFRRSFGSRGCEVSDVSLFRLGANPIDVSAHLMRQDVIYVGGGSLVNLVAVWKPHGIAGLITDCLEQGVMVVGQSAGAMCWFEAGITSSSGRPEPALGLGMLEGSLCVHYHRDPGRREKYLSEVGRNIAPGYGADDQTGLLFEDGEMVEAFSAREGAGVWRVSAEGGRAVEKPVEVVDIRPGPGSASPGSPVDDFRALNKWRKSAGTRG
ncbi:MAG TPA: peptidase E [Solirubrobacterales bacterium]|nr:peptidase E [Solirubrobacterales bacterium]